MAVPPMPPPEPPRTWTVVVPVKVLALAKSRLAALAGDGRPELALAMAMDTVVAALACPDVGRVLVVTPDPEAARATSALGTITVPDADEPGLNQALRRGAAVAGLRWPRDGIAALTADLPTLRATDLSRALGVAARSATAFVPDATGSGTTLYTSRRVPDFAPAFGPGSAQRHRAGGATELNLADLDSLRRDVDAPADLRVAARIGLGVHTITALARLGVAGTDLRCGQSGR